MQLEMITRTPEDPLNFPPLLFVHGAWHGAWCWDKYFMPYFAEQGYTTHAFSMRCHGNSPDHHKLRWCRLKGYIADLAEAVNQLPQKPIIIGHSMGGLVVQKYLEQNDLPAAFLLASVPIKGAIKATLKVAKAAFIPLLKANLTLSFYPIVETPELCQTFFFSADIPKDELREYYERIHGESYFAFIDMLIQWPKYHRVKTPVTVLGGEEDAIFDIKEMTATAKAYGGKEPVMFPKMAHDMMLEADWKKVADYMISQLKKMAIK